VRDFIRAKVNQGGERRVTSRRAGRDERLEPRSVGVGDDDPLPSSAAHRVAMR
jgi:hypothetical protein